MFLNITVYTNDTLAKAYYIVISLYIVCIASILSNVLLIFIGFVTPSAQYKQPISHLAIAEILLALVGLTNGLQWMGLVQMQWTMCSLMVKLSVTMPTLTMLALIYTPMQRYLVKKKNLNNFGPNKF